MRVAVAVAVVVEVEVELELEVVVMVDFKAQEQGCNIPLDGRDMVEQRDVPTLCTAGKLAVAAVLR